MKIIDISKQISEQDTREFNASLMKMVAKLQDENSLLREQVAHLEKLLLSTNVVNL